MFNSAPSVWARNLEDEESLKIYNAGQTGDDDHIEMGEEMDAANCDVFKTEILRRQRKKECHTLGKPKFGGCFVLSN